MMHAETHPPPMMLVYKAAGRPAAVCCADQGANWAAPMLDIRRWPLKVARRLAFRHRSR